MPRWTFWRNSLLVLLSGCSVSTTNQVAKVACPATGQTYVYRNSEGSEIHARDDENAIVISIPGKQLSADANDLSFYVERSARGVLIRNYGAINSMLLTEGHWSEPTLSCQSEREPGRTQTNVICRNGYGDVHSFIYDARLGLIEASVGLSDQHSKFVLVGQSGLFENCRFR